LIGAYPADVHPYPHRQQANMQERESHVERGPDRPSPGRRTVQHRAQAQLLLSAQNARLEEIEANLTAQYDELLRTASDSLATDAQTAQQTIDRSVQAFTDQVRQHEHSLEDFQQQHQSLVLERAEMEAAKKELADAQQAFRQSQANLQRDGEQLARDRGRCQQLEERLAREAEQLEVRREQTKDQRRRIAQELKAERTSQQHEIAELRRTIEHLRITQQRGAERATAELKLKRDEFEQLRAQHQEDGDRQREALDRRAAVLDGEIAKLAGKSAELQKKADDLHAKSDNLDRHDHELGSREAAFASEKLSGESTTARNQELNEALAEARATAAASTAAASELSQTVDELRASHERLRESAEISAERHRELQLKHEALQRQYEEISRGGQSAHGAADSPRPADWEAERAAIIDRVADAEHKLAQADPQRFADMQRRFELAVADVRDLKRRNSELEEQLLGARAERSAAQAPRLSADANLDWESTKRRMLEALEADNDSGNAQDRMTVESTIQITDEIVAEKDREIAEMRLLLSQQSSNIGTIAVGAAAIAESFDRDELIRQEREKLRVLQGEWRDKLRQAEIDISIERAKIARQRLEIDEKTSAYDSVRSQAADDAAESSGSGAKQPTRGRWLARLGLKEDPS
jgi:hypothetical protein